MKFFCVPYTFFYLNKKIQLLFNESIRIKSAAKAKKFSSCFSQKSIFIVCFCFDWNTLRICVGFRRKWRWKLSLLQTIEMQLIGQDFSQTTFPTSFRSFCNWFHFEWIIYQQTFLLLHQSKMAQKIFLTVSNLFAFNFNISREFLRHNWVGRSGKSRLAFRSSRHFMLHLIDDLFTAIKSCWSSYVMSPGS